MIINTQPLLKVLLLSLLFIFHCSCAKDTDLLADYVLADASDSTETTTTTINFDINNDYDTVENISALLALDPIAGQRINVLGYYKPNDGGGGIFQYDATKSGKNNDGIILNGWVRLYTGALNAKWWGAKGDGVTDDQPAISAALHYAYDNSLDIFFPKGDYLFATEEDHYGIKNGWAGDSAGRSFRLFGETGTKLTTALVGSTDSFKILAFTATSTNNISIENIEFENTHGLTTNSTNAIYLQSTSGHENMIIRNCIFSGFSTAITGNGTKNLLIENNKFLAPLGHDNAQNNNNPAVYIWFISNANGQNSDVTIRNNYAYGYTGTDISTTTSKKAMDGFVYSAANSGGCNGMVIEGNTLMNLSEEAIAVTTYLYYDPSAVLKPIIIRNNYIDSTFPKGTTHNTNYGILADSPTTNIYGNNIKAAYGILVNPVSATTQCKDISIHNNKIYLTDDSVLYLKPITLNGYATGELYPLENVTVQDNDIYANDLTLPSDTQLIQTADIVNAVIKDNNFFIENVILGGFDLTIYEFTQNSDNIQYGGETISGSYTNLVITREENTGITYLGVGD